MWVVGAGAFAFPLHPTIASAITKLKITAINFSIIKTFLSFPGVSAVLSCIQPGKGKCCSFPKKFFVAFFRGLRYHDMKKVINMNFAYGETEVSYLRRKDKRLCAVIDRIGHIDRAVDTDLFSSVIHHIIGQQISTKAQATIWQRMQDALVKVNAETILAAGIPKLQALGMTFRKAEYITDFAEKVHTGAFDLAAVERMSDEDAIEALRALKGIGVWTAEMILLFCMQRPDIFSYDDLAIQRGLRMVYHHREIDRALFEKYRRRFSPYCSVASLYLWAVSGGAIPEMRDYKPKSK